MNGNTRQRLTYTADNIEATIAALHRLPERDYEMTLGASDRANMISTLRAVEDLGLCNMQEWARNLILWVQNGRAPGTRQTMVNLIGLLYIVAWSGRRLGFREYQCEWSRDFYSAILDTLDIELV